MATLSFAQQLDNFVAEVKGREANLFRRVNRHVRKSILTGSPVTGAPGQPVDTRALIDSWKMDGAVTSRRVTHYSEVVHAPIIEDNLRGAKLRSKVGGFHSVKMTEAGFDAIVLHELAQLKTGYAVASGGGRFRSPVTGRFVARPR